MFCTLWVIFQTLALVAEGGLSSGSAEVGANGGGNNNGGRAGNNANAGAQNGLPANGQSFVAQVVPVGGSFFIQPIGNPIGQAPVQQQVPIGPLQQGGGFLLAQAGGANLLPQQQGQVAQFTNAGPIPFFTLLPQANVIGSPQSPMLIPGQQVQLIAVNGQNIHQQPGIGGAAAGRARAKRSVAARPRRTQPPVTKTMAPEEEESSGLDTEEKLT